MIVADTDVLIDTLQGLEPSSRRVVEALQRSLLATTTVTVFELLSGAKREGQVELISRLLRPVTIMPMDEASSRLAAEFRRDLEARGEKIGLADYLIAGICCSRGLPLLTRNRRHFERISDLELA